MNKVSLALIVVLLAGCSIPTYAAPRIDSASAQATAIKASGDAQIASVQETQTAQQALDQIQARYAVATVTAEALSAQTDSQISAVMIEQARAGATATAVSVNATVQAINRESELNNTQALSNSQVIKLQTAAKLDKAQHERDKYNDPMWSTAEWINGGGAQCILTVMLITVLGMFLLWLGRAVVARAAGSDKRAEMALNYSIIPQRLLPAPSPAVAVDNDSGNAIETDNTDTEENTENTPVFPVSIAVNHGTEAPLERMTKEEYVEFRKLSIQSLELLSRCMNYFKENNLPDDGTIPHFKTIKSGSKYRQDIVKALEYSGLVSIIDRQRTFVVPEHNGTQIGTCMELARLIANKRKRVYPVDYHERKQAIQDSAVNALPEAGLQ